MEPGYEVMLLFLTIIQVSAVKRRTRNTLKIIGGKEERKKAWIKTKAVHFSNPEEWVATQSDRWESKQLDEFMVYAYNSGDVVAA